MLRVAVSHFPDTLDQTLTEAMEKNPEIATAKAKLMLAEAELNGTRMEVAKKVIDVWNERQNKKEELAQFQQANQNTPGSISHETMIDKVAAYDRISMDLKYLLGQTDYAGPVEKLGISTSYPKGPYTRTPSKPLQLPRGPLVELVRKALLEKTEIDFNEMPLQNMIDYLKDRHQIEIQIDSQAICDAGIGTDTPISLNLRGLPLANAFQAFEDQHTDLQFVVHDYGLLVTTPKRAQNRAIIPPSSSPGLAGAGQVRSRGVHRM